MSLVIGPEQPGLSQVFNEDLYTVLRNRVVKNHLSEIKENLE